MAREGNIGAPVALDQTTRVVEFNDIAGMEKALAHGDVAAILMEPADDQCGNCLATSWLPRSGRRTRKKYGTILIIDETHTISVGPGGMTADRGLKPDFLTIGKQSAAEFQLEHLE